MLLVRSRDARRHVFHGFTRKMAGNNVHIFSVPNVSITEVVVTGEPYLAPFVSDDELLQQVLDKLEADAPLPKELIAQMVVYNIPYFLIDEEFVVPMRARKPWYLLVGGATFPISVAELSMQVWHYTGMLLFFYLMEHTRDDFVEKYRELRGIRYNDHDVPIRSARDRSLKRHESVAFLFGHDFRYFFGPAEAAGNEAFLGTVHDMAGEKDGALARIRIRPPEEIKEFILKCQSKNDS